MKLIYLDQNKWIDLARAYHGKSPDPGFRTALDLARKASASGAAVFPLSAIHYMEIARIRDSGRRARLGTVMWEISGGITIASTRAVLIHELEGALSRVRPRVQPRPFTLLSRGVAHAFGMDRPGYRIPEQLRSGVDPDAIRIFEQAAQEAIEKSVLTGVGPEGITMAPFGITSHNQNFKEHLETLYSRVSQLPPEQWEDALCAISLMDIREPLNEVLRYQGLSFAEFTSGGKDALTHLLNDLPSRRVDLQLHRQVLRNPQLKPNINDLEDWAGLGLAVAHCDAVICEKHFASLLLKEGFRPPATVLTDVRALGEVL